MQLNKYSYLGKLTHRLYLANYFVAKTSFEMELAIFGKSSKQVEIEERVFVTGLARAGTTAVFNALYATSSFASLTYANMPFLLMPNVSKLFSKTPETTLLERAHQDGILVNNKSPEAFDDYFWKVMLNDSYLGKHYLHLHQPGKEELALYTRYQELILLANGKKSYLSKNNNNIVRLTSLMEFYPSARFVVLFRDPLSHAQSLLKEHLHFSQMQAKDPFALEYFNYLGHHEFGQNLKPFCFGEKQKLIGDPLKIDYWLRNWLNYYRYLLTIYNDRWLLVSFEDLCRQPGKIAAHLNENIKLKLPIKIDHPFHPKNYPGVVVDEELYQECLEVYGELRQRRNYIDTMLKERTHGKLV